MTCASDRIAEAERICRASMYAAAEKLDADLKSLGGAEIGQLLSVIDDYLPDCTASLRAHAEEREAEPNHDGADLRAYHASVL